MNHINEDLLYSREHHWILQEDGDTCKIGITDYAQEKIGEISFIDLPEIGENIFAGQGYASIESSQEVDELIAPITGNIIDVNEEILSDPKLINQDPYGKGWLLKIKLANKDDLKLLISPEEYMDIISGYPL